MMMMKDLLDPVEEIEEAAFGHLERDVDELVDVVVVDLVVVVVKLNFY